MEKAEIFETVESRRPFEVEAHREGDADAMGDDVSCDEVSIYSVQQGLVILIPQYSFFDFFARKFWLFSDFYDSVNR